MIGPLTNLVAVPLSGPILTLGLLGSVFGNFAPVLAYPLNASNGFLVALLVWNVSGRSELSWDDAVRLDLYYVDNWSLAFDVLILWRTVGVVFRRRGAY